MYCTKTDILNLRLNASKLSELTWQAPRDPVDDEYPILDARADAACADAAGEIDAILGKVCVLPITDADALAQIKAWALDIAVHKLFARYSLENEDARKEAEAARSTLEQIRDGKALLAGSPARRTGVSVSAEDRNLTMEKMEGW